MYGFIGIVYLLLEKDVEVNAPQAERKEEQL